MRRDFAAAGNSFLKMARVVPRLLFDGIPAGALTTLVLAFMGDATAVAQSNTWSKTADGFWEEPYWSLGIPPAADQAVWFNNAGSKTLTINSKTALNFPQSLSIRS